MPSSPLVSSSPEPDENLWNKRGGGGGGGGGEGKSSNDRQASLFRTNQQHRTNSHSTDSHPPSQQQQQQWTTSTSNPMMPSSAGAVVERNALTPRTDTTTQQNQKNSSNGGVVVSSSSSSSNGGPSAPAVVNGEHPPHRKASGPTAPSSSSPSDEPARTMTMIQRPDDSTPTNNARGMRLEGGGPPRPQRSSDSDSVSDLVRRSRSFEGPPTTTATRAATSTATAAADLSVGSKTRKSDASPGVAIPRNPKDTQSPLRRSRSAAAAASSSRDAGSAHTHTTAKSAAAAAVMTSAPLKPAHSSSQQQQPDWQQWVQQKQRADPQAQEQALFEQRLCEDAYGVAVRKINQNGKSTLRYVKCVTLDSAGTDNDDHLSTTTRSVSSLARSFSRRDRQRDRSVERRMSDRSISNKIESHKSLMSAGALESRRALTWGKKKTAKLSLDRFVCVRKGKTTDRTRKNLQPASRLLSLITNDADNPSLDIEAPTRLDRDKFARAFSKFLKVPLEGEDVDNKEEEEGQAGFEAEFPPHFGAGSSVQLMSSNNSTARRSLPKSPRGVSAAHSAPDMDTAATSHRVENRKSATTKVVMAAASPDVAEHLEIQFEEFPTSFEGIHTSFDAGIHTSFEDPNAMEQVQVPAQPTAPPPLLQVDHRKPEDVAAAATANDGFEPNPQVVLSFPSKSDSQQIAGFLDRKREERKREEGTDVSSLTGAGFDQEIVEELHQALTELRVELEESRAEAARAVKVAEQAIQSAENSNSKDWNSTVTHKAAEAAALAQKKSAEALAKMRLAEDRLAAERKNAAFWKKQAETAEEEAGVLQTRAAAAEVQRAAMREELESERHKHVALVMTSKTRYVSSEQYQRQALEAAMERNRALEMELNGVRRDLLAAKNFEGGEDAAAAAVGFAETPVDNKNRKKKGRRKKNEADRCLLTGESGSPSGSSTRESWDQASTDQIVKLHAETASVRREFEVLRRFAADELQALPAEAEVWAAQTSQTIGAYQEELSRLRSKLAVETATRRKLLHEVQDLRGVVRVYCRLRRLEEASTSPKSSSSNALTSALSTPSQETVLVHRDRLSNVQDKTPVSFEFDRIFDSSAKQRDLYEELEELMLSVMDGYNVCIMAYGPTGTGKTHSLLGDVRVCLETDSEDALVKIENHGIQLEGIKQLFAVSEHRSERFQDAFSLSIVEVRDERLTDLVAGTDIGDSNGQVECDDNASRKSSQRRRANSDDGTGSSFTPSSRGKQKLEIRTNHDGDTVVQGLVSVKVESFEDVMRVWQESLGQRAIRLAEQGINAAEYEATSHVIATLKVISTNVSTGIAGVGKLQFVDMAGADLVAKRPIIGAKPSKPSPDSVLAGFGNDTEWKFVDKSFTTLNDVVSARCQFLRSVPYRNSTLTHLLRDSLEHDTKVLMLLCVSPDVKHVQETVSALKLAAKMRRVHVGKATKHTLNH